MFESIKAVKALDAKSGWAERKRILMPTVSASFCAVMAENKRTGQSLGIFKPKEVSFSFEKRKPADAGEREECYAQLSLFNKQKDSIEPIPYNFYYSFHCANEPRCPGHKLLIVDWEMGQAFRSWRTRYKSEPLLMEKLKEKWLGELCSSKKDTHFIVGNVHRFQGTFLVLGVFYPPATAKI